MTMIDTAVVLARGLGSRMRKEGAGDLTPEQAAAAASGGSPFGKESLSWLR